MTLPQIRLVLSEASKSEAERALTDLRIAGAAGLATSQAKHNPEGYRKLERALMNHT